MIGKNLVFGAKIQTLWIRSLNATIRDENSKFSNFEKVRKNQISNFENSAKIQTLQLIEN